MNDAFGKNANLIGRIKHKRNDWRTTVFIMLMLAWPVFHFCVFWVYANAQTFYLTFFNFDSQTGVYEWYGLTRFKNILDSIFINRDANIVNYVRNSLLVFPVENFIMLPLSFMTAYFLAKKIPFSGLFRIVFFLPSILSTVVVAMSFKFMFNPDFGPADNLIQKIFGSSPDWFSSQNEWAIAMVFAFSVWSGLGYKMLLLGGAIQRIPEEIYDAAALDGVGTTREMFQIVLPLVMPTISTFFTLNTLAVFGYFLHPMLLFGEDGGVNGNTGTIALRVAYSMQVGTGEDAAAFGLLFSLVGLPVILFIKWFIEKITPDVEF